MLDFLQDAKNALQFARPNVMPTVSASLHPPSLSYPTQ